MISELDVNYTQKQTQVAEHNNSVITILWQLARSVWSTSLTVQSYHRQDSQEICEKNYAWHNVHHHINYEQASSSTCSLDLGLKISPPQKYTDCNMIDGSCVLQLYIYDMIIYIYITTYTEHMTAVTTADHSILYILFHIHIEFSTHSTC